MDKDYILVKDSVCFYCQNYKHLDPDTDICCISGVEVYFDSPICENFCKYENAVKSF